jgi:hypothetical protein
MADRSPALAATRELVEQLERGLADLASADPDGALSAAAQVERLAATAANRAAAKARLRGASWSEIGAAFGISKQAAHQRFARHVRPDHG